MKLSEGIVLFLGHLYAVPISFCLGYVHGASIGWAFYLLMTVLLDIRSRIKPYC